MITKESRTDPRTMMPIVKMLLESIFEDGELLFGASGSAINPNFMTKKMYQKMFVCFCLNFHCTANVFKAKCTAS